MVDLAGTWVVQAHPQEGTSATAPPLHHHHLLWIPSFHSLSAVFISTTCPHLPACRACSNMGLACGQVQGLWVKCTIKAAFCHGELPTRWKSAVKQNPPLNRGRAPATVTSSSHNGLIMLRWETNCKQFRLDTPLCVFLFGFHWTLSSSEEQDFSVMLTKWRSQWVTACLGGCECQEGFSLNPDWFWTLQCCTGVLNKHL